VEKAAASVASTMGWDPERTATEIRDYRATMERLYRLRPGHDAPMVQPARGP
jgi:hypothetical protein